LLTNEPAAAANLQVMVSELDGLLLDCFWRFGLVIKSITMKIAEKSAGGAVFFKFRKRGHGRCTLWHKFAWRVHGACMVGGRVKIFRQLPAAAHRQSPSSSSSNDSRSKVIDSSISSFKPDVGTFGLDDGRSVNLGPLFAAGLVRFSQPFHESLCNEALGDVIGKLKSDSDALVDPKAGGDKAPSS